MMDNPPYFIIKYPALQERPPMKMDGGSCSKGRVGLKKISATISTQETAS